MDLQSACALAQQIAAEWPAYVVLSIERGPSLTQERYHLTIWRARDAARLSVGDRSEWRTLRYVNEVQAPHEP